MLIARAEVAGQRTDVRVDGETVVAVGSLRPRPGESVLDADGGALLPGLHDHHLHLLSLAAAHDSVHCGPPDVPDLDALARVLRAAPGQRVRGIGYHESVAGVLDRETLDRLVPDRPVRVQHRGGALWMLNTRALTELGLAATGDGRLWRADHLLRTERQALPDLTAVGRRLAAYGLTGVTDATPNLPPETVRLFEKNPVPQRLLLLGAPAGHPLAGPHKILPADHEPPDWTALHEEITRVHDEGRPVAVHTVTRESLVVTLSVLLAAGSFRQDRIEHAALLGEDAIALLREVDPVVVTQPGFVAERGEQYRRDIPPPEQADLYRYGSLLAAGIRVVASSDAPFADPDPWRTIAAAAAREPAERVPPRRVLDGLLTPLDDPGGAPRRIIPGVPADLCLLSVPLAEALSTPDSDFVAATLCRGEIVHRR